MGKNLKNVTTVQKAASGTAPGGMKTVDPAPGGGMIRTFSGPSIHNRAGGPKDRDGDEKQSGVDAKTTVISK